MKKEFIKSFFEKIRRGGLKVVYWDGEEGSYGDQIPYFTLIFKQMPSINFNSKDTMLALGEVDMNDMISFVVA
jgi:cyclopropane-fatty-acyl-phospholipid synthase